MKPYTTYTFYLLISSSRCLRCQHQPKSILGIGYSSKNSMNSPPFPVVMDRDPPLDDELYQTGIVQYMGRN